jgi:hypothetical protein
MPFNVGNSLYYLKQDNINLRIFSYDLDQSIKNINEALLRVKYDITSASWYRSSHYLIPNFVHYCYKKGYNITNKITCENAAQLFISYCLNGDGITLPINSNNMGGEGGRSSMNSNTLELEYLISNGGFWGKHSNMSHKLEVEHHELVKKMPVRPLYHLPESPENQLLLMNIYYKNNSLFKKEFLEKYEPNVSILRFIQRTMTFNNSSWKGNKDFNLKNVLDYVRENKNTASELALIELGITNFKLNINLSASHVYENKMENIKAKIITYNNALDYWVTTIPHFWQPHLKELNLWPEHIVL